jgi:hypothetical protein
LIIAMLVFALSATLLVALQREFSWHFSVAQISFSLSRLGLI